MSPATTPEGVDPLLTVLLFVGKKLVIGEVVCQLRVLGY